MGLTPRVLPSNARAFPARPALASYTSISPPLFPPLPSAGCEPEIEIFFGSFFLVFLLDNASNMCADSLYMVSETSPRFSRDVPGVRPLSAAAFFHFRATFWEAATVASVDIRLPWTSRVRGHSENFARSDHPTEK